MSKQLQIGSEIYNYPEAGEKAGWGEDATSWAVAVTDALADVQGPNDILDTSANLTNNQSTYANIPGLSFNTAEVQHIMVEFLVIREYDSGATTDTESGTIIGNYNGSIFQVNIDSVGETGIDINITNAGQMQYKTTNLANHISSVIRFKAKTIDQP